MRNIILLLLLACMGCKKEKLPKFSTWRIDDDVYNIQSMRLYQTNPGYRADSPTVFAAQDDAGNHLFIEFHEPLRGTKTYSMANISISFWSYAGRQLYSLDSPNELVTVTAHNERLTITASNVTLEHDGVLFFPTYHFSMNATP